MGLICDADLLDRVLYLILTPFGTIAENPQVVAVFADLPALIFLSIFSLTVIRWAEIYHVLSQESVPLVMCFL